VCRYSDKAVASYFQIGTFEQPVGKSRFFSCGGEGNCFLLWCFVVRDSVSWLVVLLSGVMNRELLIIQNIMHGSLFSVFCYIVFRTLQCTYLTVSCSCTAGGKMMSVKVSVRYVVNCRES